MLRPNDFKRAIAMFAAIAAAMKITDIAGQRTALDDIGPYRSRGKGRRNSRLGKRYGTRHSKYRVPHQSTRECERRVRQVARGMHAEMLLP